jgi:hypothetical protein
MAIKKVVVSSDTSYMELIIDISTDRFDILGVKVERGPWLLSSMSVYMLYVTTDFSRSG